MKPPNKPARPRPAILERVKRIEKALREVEWIKLEDFFTYSEFYTANDLNRIVCPYCGWKEPDGHFKDCLIGQVLGGE